MPKVEDKPNEKTRPTASAILKDGSLVEMLYRPDTRSTTFAVLRQSEWAYERQVTDDDGSKLVPFSADNNLIKNEAVLLPSEPREYDSEERLIGDVRSFLHRYTDLSVEFEQLATYYVLLTWVYDAFNEVPYLRLRGDFGTGKTRTLSTIGSICYKTFFASGASTVSPIFHTLDAFRGTLIFDEADFRFSDERAEIVKILNNGNVRGMPVLRTMMNRQKEFNPQAFQVFGPKIVATRSDYTDKGLESRFLTEDMGGRPLRYGIPINLPESFKDEARELRNKLLLFRFRRRHAVRLDASLSDPNFEPRLNQILLPLLSIVSDAHALEPLRWVAQRVQNDLVAERGLRIEAQVLGVICAVLSAKEGQGAGISEIATKLTEKYGADYARPITPRWVGGIVRRRLNLRTYKAHGVYVIPASETAKVDLLCARYGIQAPGAGSVASGDEGTSGTE